MEEELGGWTSAWALGRAEDGGVLPKGAVSSGLLQRASVSRSKRVSDAEG